MQNINSKNKILALKTALILMAVYFSMLELLIPKPFPWMKLGLANISTVIGLNRFGIRFGMEITILRILIYSIMTGTILSPGFLISFIAGICSTFGMGILFSFNHKFSILAISSFGGFLHNFAQLIIVYFMLFKNIDIFQKSVFLFIGIFLILGFLSGTIVGFFSNKYKNIMEV